MINKNRFLFILILLCYFIFFDCGRIFDPKNRVVNHFEKNKEKFVETAEYFIVQKKIKLLNFDNCKLFRINDVQVDMIQNKYWEKYIYDRKRKYFRNFDEALDYYNVNKDTFNVLCSKLKEINCKFIMFSDYNPNNVEFGLGDIISGPAAYGLLYIPSNSTINPLNNWSGDYFIKEKVLAKWYYFYN